MRLVAALEAHVAKLRAQGMIAMDDPAVKDAVEIVSLAVEEVIEDSLDSASKAQDVFSPDFPVDLVSIFESQGAKISLKELE
eukprot:CAMPEP_0170468606 /NCGR_PEP_ID=MMETSP0123-20130129/11720_1 /TAXON_ID=182087 /ORGANISM="Favella ehrenbergii, Strain Fehren 1" /LENGTH=81 /DNA_ID=CAMNT_0010735211 /DNA_START=671 /DNA_END=916 /DNA_ORIENTATION=-